MAEIDRDWPVMLRDAWQQVRAEMPKYPNEPALLSVLAQLEYLIALADGKESDRSALPKINIGYLAAYPLAGVIPDKLDKLLCEIAEKVRRELKRAKRETEGGAKGAGIE